MCALLPYRLNVCSLSDASSVHKKKKDERNLERDETSRDDKKLFPETQSEPLTITGSTCVFLPYRSHVFLLSCGGGILKTFVSNSSLHRFLFSLERSEKRIHVSDSEHNRRRTETSLNEMCLSQKRLTQFDIKKCISVFWKNTTFDSSNCAQKNIKWNEKILEWTEKCLSFLWME